MAKPGRQTGSSIQVAVRLPLALHEALLVRGTSVSAQLIEGARLLIDADRVAAVSEPGLPAMKLPPRNQVGLRMDRPLPGSTDNGGPGVPVRGRLVGTTDETPAAHWTAGPRCPKCGWMLRAGRCANKECKR